MADYKMLMSFGLSDGDRFRLNDVLQHIDARLVALEGTPKPGDPVPPTQPSPLVAQKPIGGYISGMVWEFSDSGGTWSGEFDPPKPEKPKPLEPGWYLVQWVNGNSYGAGEFTNYGQWANGSGTIQAPPIRIDQPIKKPKVTL